MPDLGDICRSREPRAEEAREFRRSQHDDAVVPADWLFNAMEGLPGGPDKR
jgi:hypothetical protein